jgi:hypothetical protein
MTHNIVSFSFVFLWKKPVQIPMLENKFCKDLFDDPYTTEVGFTPEGFIINLAIAQIPNPHVIIGPLKADFVCTSLNQLYSVIEKVSTELTRIKMGALEISAIGVNTEYEFLGLSETSQSYLAKRFLSGGFKNENHFPLNMTDLRFRVNTNENDSYNLLIQPRANQPNGLYININAHKQVDITGMPDTKSLAALYSTTEAELKTLIFPSLDLEG